MDATLRVLEASWRSVHKPYPETIPCRSAELIQRATINAFDRGRTARWLSTIDAKWIGLRDRHTGHEIHCVSDRVVPRHELVLGLHLMAWMSRASRLTWFWWDQPWMRLLPAGEQPGASHVNGGWAYIGGPPEVHVYRREEAHKVLLHECIHVLGLDVPATAASVERLRFEEHMGTTLWPHLGEAWTEMYAELLWSVAGGSSLPLGLAWQRQKSCAERQAAEVWARWRNTDTNEDTNVFAYYVLKWVLMLHEDCVILDTKTRCLNQWFDWWLAALPDLERAAASVAHTTKIELPMGMTCASRL